MFPQLRCGSLFIEKKNMCPNKIRRIHYVLLVVGDQNKQKKNHISIITKNLISTLILLKRKVFAI